ncbi:zinc carboxypeptidase [Diachasma alloeum]|uniref:zinc carboxypeptidase n=1 Tax=Diachasma alloeum TaxID=454923 RepID=UPI000738254E|nr:zinc carboxypeptidase [Diachasma alloeum]XP_015125503.1 zinc carboxypeptidase [Diachasma alloeum]
MLKFVVFVGLIGLALAQKESFENYKVFRILPTNDEQIALLHQIADTSDGQYSFWNEAGHVNVTADLMVAPQKIEEFERLMALTETKYVPYIDNVQQLIDDENPSLERLTTGFDWTSYHKLDEINAWLDSLASTYPDKVQAVVAGKTYEGRQIKGVKVSFKEGNPGVFIEGNIHAREWITAATVTYILNQLLTSKDPAVRELADRHDWYIFPVFNPDGYAFTHTTNRLWRKTRKPYSSFCRGSDPNRNWGYKWMQGGASRNPCAETYAGSAAFSDIETKSASQFIASISNKIYAYISFHSYSQLLLFPYGHTSAHLDNYDDLYAIGTETINALAKRYGTKYVTGNIAETIYIASGSSVDYVKGTFQTPITYTYELRDKGRYGFLLPANQIIPTGEETLDSLVAMFKSAQARGYPRNA